MRLGMLDDPNLYIYRVHGTNAWDPVHFERVFANAEPRADLKDAIDERLAWAY
jgi:hypothetical protein